MIPILPRQSSEDDRPMGLKFTRNNFFNFPKRDMNDIYGKPASNTSQLPPIMSIKREEPTTLSRTSSYASSVSSPTIPTRSPFRIRDSQMSANSSNTVNNKFTSSYVETNKSNSVLDERPTVYSSVSSSSSSSVTTIEDDLAHELENIWKLKSTTSINNQLKEKIDMNSEDMLLQLLISHAVIEAKDYKVVSFEDYETLKQHLVRLTGKIKNAETKLDVDKKIQETSHSLSNLSTNKNRESVLLLLDEAFEADRKVKILSQRLNELKSEQVDTQYQILQHTAGVLCLGLQKLETEYQHHIPTPPLSTSDNKKLELLQAEIDSIKNTLISILKKYINVPSSTSTTILLEHLDSQLKSHKSEKNQLEFKLNTAEERSRIELMSEKKLEIQLRATQSKKAAADKKILDLEQQIDKVMHNNSAQKEFKQEHFEIEHLRSTISEMEQKCSKIQSQATVLQQREKGLRDEIESYRDQVVHLRNEKEKLERTMKRKSIVQDLANEMPLEAKYEQQLEEQEQEYQAQLNEQAAFLDKTNRHYEQLKNEHDKLSATCRDLEMLIRDKQKALDARDAQISKLESDLKSAPTMDHAALERVRNAFSEKEAAWIESSTAMEANFEGILKEFDRLTGTAMEFETLKQKYEKRIDQLTQEVRQLESSLNTEKTKTPNQQNDTHTTASLRKEFRKMITDMKADHQRTLDREIEERKRLEKQLKDLKHEREMSRYERTNKGVQTLFIP